jgi:hypothetical protein
LDEATHRDRVFARKKSGAVKRRRFAFMQIDQPYAAG